MSDSATQRDMERCYREIADIERQIRAGCADLRGLLLALSDWSAELRILANGNERDE